MTQQEIEFEPTEIDRLKKKLTKRWKEFFKMDAENPDIWKAFERFTLEAANQRDYYSQWAIMQRIRWFTEIEERGGDFKISNNWIGFYARKFMLEYPQLDGFFTVKPLKEEVMIRKLEGQQQ